MTARKILGVVSAVMVMAGIIVGAYANFRLAGIQVSSIFVEIGSMPNQGHAPYKPVELQCSQSRGNNDAVVVASIQNVDQEADVHFTFTASYEGNEALCEETLHLEAEEQATLECTMPLSELGDEQIVFLKGKFGREADARMDRVNHPFRGVCLVLPEPDAIPLVSSLTMIVAGSIGWVITQKPAKLNFRIGLVGVFAIVTGVCSLVLWFAPMQLAAMLIGGYMPVIIGLTVVIYGIIQLARLAISFPR